VTKYLTFEELNTEAKRRFGDNDRAYAFACPRCGDVATLQDFLDVGKPEAIGQDCIGRHLGALTGAHRPDKKGIVRGDAPRGCDWCAYGLFPGPWLIQMPNGKPVWSFPLAPGNPKPTAPGTSGSLGESILRAAT
jgi:hypothetical protein